MNTARALVATLGLALLATACTDRRRADVGPPAAEFLVAAGDSTYWVRSGPTGIRVRSAPILLTEADGEFHEIYIIEDGVDYDDASFGAARVYSHRVLGKDSVLLFQDSTVLRHAASWKRRHPREQPIDPDSDEPLQDPATMVTEEIEIVDVHGPWLSLTHSLDVDTDRDEEHRHSARRAVVDVRTGRLATLEALFGRAEAGRLVATAQASLRRLLDSVRMAGDDRAEAARETLNSFRFDSTSFAVADISRAPAVSFMVPGRNPDGEALALYLPPVAAAVPGWWKDVQPTRPAWTPDSAQVSWEQARYRVVARPSADGETMVLVLQARAGGDARDADSGAVRPVDAASGREWSIATVAAPAYGMIALDPPKLDAATRSALARAFDMSTALDGLTQSVVFSKRSASARRDESRAMSRRQRSGARWTTRPVADLVAGAIVGRSVVRRW